MGLFDSLRGFAAKAFGAAAKDPTEDFPPDTPFHLLPLEERNRRIEAEHKADIDRLRKAYDFTTADAIDAIPVPCREVNHGALSGRVEAHLKGACYVEHRDAGRTDAAAACLKKALQLMFVSPIYWPDRDFTSCVQHLHNIGHHDEAREYQHLVDTFLADREKNETQQRLDRLPGAIRTCAQVGEDLIEFCTTSPCCPECAKYAGRVFSIGGTHPVFPPIPENLPTATMYHRLQCLDFTPYHWGFDPDEDRQKVALSKKSYVDLRTQEERERYEAWAAQMADLRAEEARKKAARDEYNWLAEHLPDVCPKSLGSYSRMRNARSAGFLKLAEEAAKLGRELGVEPDSD